MKMRRFKTISEFHQFNHKPKPEHPLISVWEVEPSRHIPKERVISWVYDFYCIGFKKISNTENIKVKYGQQPYDFEEGLMSFVAPNQVVSFSIDEEAEEIKQSGWMLLIHPDFLWNTPLAKRIKQYEYFNYSVNESLFLSEKEEKKIIEIIKNIQQEYQSNIDNFSQDIIITYLETLLKYADRFYHRQFLTRKKSNHQIIERLENLLTDYFMSDNLISKGLPTAKYISDELNVSVSYLSRLLKTLTGQSTQQHIHNKLIEKAKEKLSTTELSVSEIAYEVGFEHPQSFSKLFKQKTNQSPLEFRASFN